jgi:hypothetical protein
MGRYNRLFLQELAEIAQSIQGKEDANNPTTVLIGGRAVDSYNLWFGQSI